MASVGMEAVEGEAVVEESGLGGEAADGEGLAPACSQEQPGGKAHRDSRHWQPHVEQERFNYRIPSSDDRHFIKTLISSASEDRWFFVPQN